jgi:hypothetical protein
MLYRFDASKGLKRFPCYGGTVDRTCQLSDKNKSQNDLIQAVSRLDPAIPRTQLLIFWARSIQIFITKSADSDNRFLVKEDLDNDDVLGHIYLEDKWKEQTDTEQTFILFAEEAFDYDLMMIEKDGDLFRRAGLTVPSAEWKRFWKRNLRRVQEQIILLA